MKLGLLDRYIFRIVVTRVLSTFVIVVTIFFVLEVVERHSHYSRYIRSTSQSTGRDLIDIVTFCLSRLLPVLVQFGSLCTLLGCIFAVSHLAKHNEFVAIRAAGVSLRRALAPAFLMGLLVSSTSFVLGESVLPALTLRGQQLEARILDRRRKFAGALAIQGTETFDGRSRHVVLHVDRFDPDSQTALGFKALIVDERGHERLVAPAAAWRGDGWYFVSPSGQPLGRRYRYADGIVGEHVTHLITRLSPALLLSQRLGPGVLTERQLFRERARPALATALHRRLAAILAGFTVLGLGLPLLLGDPNAHPWRQRSLALTAGGGYLIVTWMAGMLGSSAGAGGWTSALAVWVPEAAFLGLAFHFVYGKMDG